MFVCLSHLGLLPVCIRPPRHRVVWVEFLYCWGARYCWGTTERIGRPNVSGCIGRIKWCFGKRKTRLVVQVLLHAAKT